MKLEDEIKQTKFKSEYQKLFINILFTSNWLMSKDNVVLKPYGISIQQYNILRILKGQHPKSASINLLIERMLDKNSNASRLVDKLENKNLVIRTECPADRRKVDVVISEEGIALLETLSGKMEKSMLGFKSFKESEVVMMNNYLDKLRST